MSQTTLPEFIVVEGTSYQLSKQLITEGEFAGWTSIQYINPVHPIPPSVKLNNTYIEYLVSMHPSEDEAISDMKRKIHDADFSKNYSLIGLNQTQK